MKKIMITLNLFNFPLKQITNMQKIPMFFILFFFFPLYAPLSFYIQNSSNCNSSFQTGDLTTPFCSLTSAFNSTESISLQSQDSDICYILISPKYYISPQINSSKPYFSEFFKKNVSIISQDYSLVILETNNVKFGISNNLTIKNITFQGGTFFQPKLIKQTFYLDYKFSSYTFSSLFVFIQSTNFKVAFFCNIMFDRLTFTKNDSFSSLILMNDNQTGMTFYNSSFQNLFFSHTMIYTQSKMLTITTISFFNCSFMNYNTLDSSIIFINFPDHTLQGSHKFMFSFNKGRIYLVAEDILIEDILYFSRNSESNLYLKNVIIKSSPINSDSMLFWINGSTFNLLNAKLNFSNVFIHLEQKNNLIIKYFYLQSAIIVPSMFNLTLQNSLNLQFFYVDSITVTSPMMSFFIFNNNSSLYMNNTFFINIAFPKMALMSFFKVTSAMIYNIYLISCTSKKSVIQVAITNNISNSILIKSIFMQNMSITSFMCGSISPNYLTISNLIFNNSMVREKMMYFISNQDLTKLSSNIIFNNATFISLWMLSFFADLTLSNVTFNNTLFENLSVDLGFLAISTMSSIYLISTKFLNVINGDDDLFPKSVSDFGYFIKINNANLSIISVIISNYTSTKSISQTSVIFNIMDLCSVVFFDVILDQIGLNASFIQSNSHNEFDLTWISLSGITILNPRAMIKINSLTRMYISNSSFSQIRSTDDGSFISVDQNNQITISNTTIDAIYNNEDSKGGCFGLNNNNSLAILNCKLSNFIAVYGTLGYFGILNYLYIFDSIVINLMATKTAAGLFLTESNIVEIYNSNFTNTYAKQDSGFIFLSLNNQITLSNVVINNSYSELCGGTIYGLNDNVVNIYDSIFLSSKAILSGGLFYFASSNVITLKKNYVFNCTADQFSYTIDLNRFNMFISTEMLWEQSDGLYNGYLGSMSLMDWEAKDNYQKDSSELQDFSESNVMIGFITNFHSSLNITTMVVNNYTGYLLMFSDSSFVNLIGFKLSNTIFSKASIFEIRNSQVLCVSLELVNNSGGMFQFSYSHVTIKTMKFIGSGYQLLEAINSRISISRSSFICHTTVAPSNDILPSYGGFFELTDSIFILSRSMLIGGYAINGGAISLTDSELSFHNNVCLMNQAMIHGGCFYITHNNNQINVEDNNTSKDPKYNNLNMTKNLIIANTAKLGGGIFIESSLENPGRNHFFNVTAHLWIFRANKANKGGGIFKDEMSIMTGSELKFLSNRAITLNGSSFGKGGGVYTNCTQKCYLDSEIVYNVLFEDNLASFGGAVFLEHNPFDKYTAENIMDNNITFRGNIGSYYGNDFATIPAQIVIKTMDSDVDSTYIEFQNLISGNYYQCIFYIVGVDYFGNLVTLQENPLNLQISERNNNSLNSLSLVPDYNNLLCLKNTLITNPRPNLNLFFDINFKDGDRFSSSFLHVNLTFRPCEMGERQTDDFRCESCAMGYYSFQKNSTEKCLPCDDSLPFYCLGSSFVGPKPNYWRMDYYSDNFIRCPNPSSCLGYNVSTSIYFEPSKSTGLCREGYKGVLCAECAKGYGITNGNFCTSCGSFWYYFNIIFFFAFRLFLIIYSLHSAVAMCTSAAAGLLKRKEIISATIMKILMNHFQVLNIILSFPMEWKQSVYEFLSIPMAVSPSISDSYSVQCLFQALNISISNHFVKIVNIWLSILFLMGICYAYYRFYLTKKIKFYLKFIKKTENDVLESTYIIILFIVYLDILSVCLETFSCRNIGYGNINEYRLIKDYSVQCWNENHKGWAYGLVVPFLVLFGLGFPISILYVLIQKKKKKKLNRQDLMLRYGYFYLSYERKYFYWDFVILIRKILLSSMSIFLLVIFTGILSYIVTIMMLILLVFLYLQIECRPYLKKELKSVNNLEKCSLISLSGTMFVLIFGCDTQFSHASGFFLFLAVFFNSFFFIAWGILYYESDFRKTLKTILYFSMVCLKSFYYKLKDCCTVNNFQPTFSQRRRGISRNKDSKIVIFDNYENYLHEMEEMEITDDICKILPPKNFHLQLDFTYFNIENVSSNSRKLNTSLANERISSTSPNDTEAVPNRHSKFFTIDSSPQGVITNKATGSKSEMDSLRMENQFLSDNLKKAKKEIHNLKYLFLVNQDFNMIEGKKQMEKELQDDQFFMQEILINYENFLKAMEESKCDETNKLALIQNEGMLFKDEKVEISYTSSIHKIKTNNPQISIKFRIVNVSYIFIHSMKIKYKSNHLFSKFVKVQIFRC